MFSLIATMIGLVCTGVLGIQILIGSASTNLPIATLEIRYPLAAAGEVTLVWGINGWRQIAEEMRPPGTVLRQEVMATPMALKDNTFTLTIKLESGTTINYGFLINKTARGTRAEIWDGDYSHGPIMKDTDILTVKSANLYQNPFVLVDRSGILFVAAVGVILAGLFGIALWCLRSEFRSGSVHEPSYEDDARFAAIVSAVAFILGLVVIFHHEMWRDELQAWRIATGSSSLSELLENSRYEGHPLLWYLCLYALSRISHDPVFMQVFHVGIGCTAIYIMCRFAPFTRWQKACLAGGYLLFYEYLILSRNYSLGVLALVAFCTIRSKSPDRILTCAVCLAVMINTSAFGAIVALACGGWLLLDSFVRPDRVSLVSRAGVVCILGLGVVIATTQTAPPSDNSPRMVGWSAAVLVEPLEWTISAIWKSYVPLPRTVPHFWNSNLLDEIPTLRLGKIAVVEARDIQTILSVGLLAAFSLMLRRSPSVMLLYLVATSCLLLFMHFKVNHGIRHTGHLFLVLIACLWLSFCQQRPSPLLIRQSAVTIAVTMLFVSQAVAGAVAAAVDLAWPFSAAKETAEFLQRRGYADATMVGSKYFMVSTVANYLDRPMYYAETKNFGTFSHWKGGRSAVSSADLLRTAREMVHLHQKDVVIVVSYDLGAAGDSVQKLATFQRSIVLEERYWLYFIPHQDQISFDRTKDSSPFPPPGQSSER